MPTSIKADIMTLEEAYDKGWRDCLRRYSWGAFGAQYVGLGGFVTYADALVGRRREWQYAPPTGSPTEAKEVKPPKQIMAGIIDAV